MRSRNVHTRELGRFKLIFNGLAALALSACAVQVGSAPRGGAGAGGAAGAASAPAGGAAGAEGGSAGAADDGGAKTCKGAQAVPLEKPCAGGELLQRHAYSQCQSDCFWHVVEDDLLACPPDGAVQSYRVFDQRTEQRCDGTAPAPSAAGIRYPVMDPTCSSPVAATPPSIVITSCADGFWRNDQYDVVQCLDGTTRIAPHPSKGTTTTTPCNEAMPPAPTNPQQ